MKRCIFASSIVLNLIVAIPTLVILFASGTTRQHVYQNVLAQKVGDPEIVFLGDSLTYQGGIWGRRLGEWNTKVWNLGRGGYTTRQVALVSDSLSRHSDLKYVFVMVGINEPERGAEGIQKALEQYARIITNIRTAGAHPVVQLTLYTQDQSSEKFVTDFNAGLRKLAEQNDASVIDLNQILAPDRQLLPKFSKDGIHLTELAYDEWVAVVRDFLENSEAS